ncbi:MAG: SUMF1/EgtB/PvdO family nonheme iron enzyme [Bryobacteraceae bacterium]|jgi:rhamnogalacturonan endolyase
MRPTILAVTALLAPALLTGASGDGFAKIPAGSYSDGRSTVHVDAFELAVHPITNAEYREFVQATGHAAPLHWEQGRIPTGWENYPVIFVNRYDAEAYIQWRTKRESRIYRLPTAAEFTYAARAGNADAVYPWGREGPDGKANYSQAGDRSYNEWRRYLEPVEKRAPNPWGLYDMAGNVWQFVDTFPFPSFEDYTYRLMDPASREHALLGGSWYRPARYLQCGYGGSADSGLRHPDMGFRVAREAAGTTNYHHQTRRIVALSRGQGGVLVSWQLLPGDAPNTGFHVYRSSRPDAGGESITAQAVTDSTNYLDRQPPKRPALYYRVRPVLGGGREGAPSEWARVDPAGAATQLAAIWKPTVMATNGSTGGSGGHNGGGGFVPVFGDLDGDGVLDVVFRLDNAIAERTPDTGRWIELEAMTSYGKSLWRRPLMSHELSWGNPFNVPVVVWDLDGDGKAEVICRLEENHQPWLAVLDGMTGHVLRKVPWRKMSTDFAKTSSRIHMAIAYLDGKTPSIITQTGLYENEIFDAYDGKLTNLWTFRSLMETSGSGSHRIEIADVDGDGRDEIFDGTTLLGPDGRVRWSIYRGHPDTVQIKHILPDLPGRQVYYGVETTDNAGGYVVDAKTGKIIWKHNHDEDPTWTHSHVGWASDIWEGSPGMELLNNRDGHTAKDLVLFSADGKILMEPFPQGWNPANWTGGAVRDLISSDGTRIGRFTGHAVEMLSTPGPSPRPGSSCVMAGDILGDYRDEIICKGQDADGAPAMFVYTNTEPVAKREVTHSASHEYALWLQRNFGGGYGEYFEWQPPDK